MIETYSLVSLVRERKTIKYFFCVSIFLFSMLICIFHLLFFFSFFLRVCVATNGHYAYSFLRAVHRFFFVWRFSFISWERLFSCVTTEYIHIFFSYLCIRISFACHSSAFKYCVVFAQSNQLFDFFCGFLYLVI